MFEIIPPLVNFAVVVLILWKFGKKPLGDFLLNRSKTIENQMREAEAESSEAQKMLSEAKKNWQVSSVQSAQFMEEARSTMLRLREQTVAAAKLEAERVKQESTLVGQGEVLKAKAGLQKELAHRSVEMAEQYLESHLGEKDRHKLVSDYVEILGHGTAG